MKYVLFMICLLALSLSGCGFSSTENEVSGQVKRVVHKTPYLCPNHYQADLSLGIMRNGVGSVSGKDLWLEVPNAGDVTVLKTAAEKGWLVKITYGVARFTFCREDHLVTKAEIIE